MWDLKHTVDRADNRITISFQKVTEIDDDTGPFFVSRGPTELAVGTAIAKVKQVVRLYPPHLLKSNEAKKSLTEEF